LKQNSQKKLSGLAIGPDGQEVTEIIYQKPVSHTEANYFGSSHAANFERHAKLGNTTFPRYTMENLGTFPENQEYRPFNEEELEFIFPGWAQYHAERNAQNNGGGENNAAFPPVPAHSPGWNPDSPVIDAQTNSVLLPGRASQQLHTPRDGQVMAGKISSKSLPVEKGKSSGKNAVPGAAFQYWSPASSPTEPSAGSQPSVATYHPSVASSQGQPSAQASKPQASPTEPPQNISHKSSPQKPQSKSHLKGEMKGDPAGVIQRGSTANGASPAVVFPDKGGMVVMQRGSPQKGPKSPEKGGQLLVQKGDTKGNSKSNSPTVPTANEKPKGTNNDEVTTTVFALKSSSPGKGVTYVMKTGSPQKGYSLQQVFRGSPEKGAAANKESPEKGAAINKGSPEKGASINKGSPEKGGASKKSNTDKSGKSPQKGGSRGVVSRVLEFQGKGSPESLELPGKSSPESLEGRTSESSQ
jgi:hypothetical protein